MLDGTQETGADIRCAIARTTYENRSDTTINVITQQFGTTYTPKHKFGTYPDLKNGPTKTVSQVAGIPPFQTRTLMWEVCAPELVRLQSPLRPDGTDSFQSEIGIQTLTFTWTWFH